MIVVDWVWLMLLTTYTDRLVRSKSVGFARLNPCTPLKMMAGCGPLEKVTSPTCGAAAPYGTASFRTPPAWSAHFVTVRLVPRVKPVSAFNQRTRSVLGGCCALAE